MVGPAATKGMAQIQLEASRVRKYFIKESVAGERLSQQSALSTLRRISLVSSS
jgi:hypothetical protein